MTRPGQPPNSQPPARPALRGGGARAAAPRREALLVTTLVVVAIVVIVGVAFVFSRDGDSQAGAPNTPGGEVQGQLPAGEPTATVAGVVDPTDTTAETNTDTQPTATTGHELPPLPTNTPTAQDDEPEPTRTRDQPEQGTGGGDTPQPPQGDVPSDGAQASEADGFIADDAPISVWDTWHPALANLDAGLLAAIQQAATDAEAEGIVMVVTSGWRSAAYQQALLDDAIILYGSEEEARKWVKTPDTSTHVFGTAIDIGYTDADYWLIERGSAYGLCQTYANEIWHFELTVEPGGTCPPPVEDASLP